MKSINALEEKIAYAAKLGRQAFREGKQCEPNIGMKIPYSLIIDEEVQVLGSWMDGWKDESVKQSLPDGMSA